MQSIDSTLGRSSRSVPVALDSAPPASGVDWLKPYEQSAQLSKALRGCLGMADWQEIVRLLRQLDYSLLYIIPSSERFSPFQRLLDAIDASLGLPVGQGLVSCWDDVCVLLTITNELPTEIRQRASEMSDQLNRQKWHGMY